VREDISVHKANLLNAMKMYGSGDFHTLFTSALVGGKWSASRPGRFTPENLPRYRLDKGLAGPQIHSGQYEEMKIRVSIGTRNPTARLSSP
jgi:hypothetical protein